MAFWTQKDIEPKRNFRFLVQLGEDIVWWAKTAKTPSYSSSPVEHNYLDNKYFFPGRITWEDVTVSLVDPVSIDAVKKTNEYIIGKNGDVNYKVKQENDNEFTISKRKAIDALGQVTITVLGPEGDAIETWELHNAFITSATYGDLDYSSDELRSIDLTIKYDWASCETADGTEQFTTSN